MQRSHGAPSPSRVTVLKTADGGLIDRWGTLKGYAAPYLWAAKRYGID
ncbi:MAG: hypothetical protein AB1714_14030 [Acidobacteriota bacterium]